MVTALGGHFIMIVSLLYMQGLLTGTLDQKNGLLRVKSVMARDVKDSDIDALIETLVTWKQSIGQLSEAVHQSSWYMSDQRQQAQEEKKSAQEAYDTRKKEVKVHLLFFRSFKVVGNTPHTALLLRPHWIVASQWTTYWRCWEKGPMKEDTSAAGRGPPLTRGTFHLLGCVSFICVPFSAINLYSLVPLPLYTLCYT